MLTEINLMKLVKQITESNILFLTQSHNLTQKLPLKIKQLQNSVAAVSHILLCLTQFYRVLQRTEETVFSRLFIESKIDELFSVKRCLVKI